MAMSRISLRLRLLAYFIAVASMGLIGIGLGFALLSSTGRAATEQYERITHPYSALMRVSIVLQRMATGVRDVVIADNDSDLGRAMSFLDGQDADMESAISEYLGCLLPDESRARFKGFQEKLAPYRASIAELSEKAGRNDRATFSSSLKALRSQAQGLQASIDSLASEMDSRAFSQAKAARSSVALATTSFAIFGFLCVALSVAFALVSSRSIALPMRRMGELASAIADGDLSRELSLEAIGRRDEIGALASSIAGMRAGLLGNIEHIKSATASLSEMGRTLARNSEAASTAAAAIVASVAQAKSRVVDQSAGVSETSATTERILKSIAALDGQIEEQAGSVASSSSSVEQMVANIRAVTRSVELLGASFAELGSASDSGNRMLSEMSARIASISSQSEKLDEANGAVSNIATQTNLLAMNAAIEAAHAGQAGKGFAVVADEIRKLAESASSQSKEISRDIGEIKESIAAIVPSSEETSKAFAEIMRLISTLVSMEEEIKRAMVEQSEGSKDVLGAIERIEAVTANVRRGSSEIREGSKSIAREMRELLDGSIALSSAMEEIERISASVEGVSGDVRVIAEGATTQVAILSELASRYRLPDEVVPV